MHSLVYFSCQKRCIKSQERFFPVSCLSYTEEQRRMFEVRPGIILTDMTAGVRGKYEHLVHDEGITPIRRLGVPEDVAAQVLAACSGLLDFGTGTVLNADGGFHLRRL